MAREIPAPAADSQSKRRARGSTPGSFAEDNPRTRGEVACGSSLLVPVPKCYVTETLSWTRVEHKLTRRPYHGQAAGREFSPYSSSRSSVHVSIFSDYTYNSSSVKMTPLCRAFTAYQPLLFVLSVFTLSFLVVRP